MKKWIGLFGWGVSALASFGQNNEVTTTFTWPVAPVENYHTDSGPFLDLANLGKYHLGEDWNAYDFMDFGNPVYAVSDGKVVSVQNITKSDRWGKVAVIEHVLLNQKKLYSLYAHLKDLSVSEGAVVTEGQQIGTIGDANGYYGPHNGSGPHLHFEIRDNPNWRSFPQAYLAPPLDLAIVRRYKNPSLFIDDRLGLQSVLLTAGQWQVLKPSVNASMALVYVAYGDRKMTFNQAVTEKLLNGTIQFRWPGEWT